MRLWFPSNVQGQRYAKYIHFTTKYICAVKYQTLEILWHAAINVPRAWRHDSPCHGCQEHDTLQHATFPDTSRFDLRLVGYREISRLQKFHEITHFTQCKGKTYSSFVNHWGLGKPRRFVTLKTVYSLLSDKFCAFSFFVDLLWNLTKGFASSF